jgi:uncharacterized protein (TIGR00369 family)
MEDRPPPAGFEPYNGSSPVIDAWAPLFSKRTSEAVHLGLWLRAIHGNARGFAHGGVIATLADVAMGLSAAFFDVAESNARRLVTVSLSLDYLHAGQVGHWLEVKPPVLRIGSSLAFVDALVDSDAKVIARTSASFKIVDSKRSP